MKVTLIHNPDAGDDQQPSADELLGLMRQAGHTASYQSSKDENWPSALEQSCDIVAVVGGDGIVGTVAKHLSERWEKAPRVKFDVGMASGPWNSKYFIEGLGIGLFTETMYRLDATNNVDLAHLDDTGEKVKSVLEILKERLPSFTPNSLKITLDGRDMSGKYILVEVMNISYIGPNLCLAPHANPSDGLLDIVFVSKDGQDNLSKCLAHCIEGKLPYPGLTVRTGQHLQIEWDGFTIHTDDEV